MGDFEREIDFSAAITGEKAPGVTKISAGPSAASPRTPTKRDEDVSA
eukprot:CAMPEP_0118949660 /NCGR_PEP_ID=MMETSP1169-20130426/50047_1 /TAXON_ID=36882 /ORGANISM="Pyramimonas obovata, Strain CCMP722" /LENGTH=46 /DNA_ID= /DNA_START= /DNA_END= /DNA_ORIENTATION=